jgi:hypothetical protein
MGVLKLEGADGRTLKEVQEAEAERGSKAIHYYIR